VAIAGDTVVVGAYLEASNATGVNGNQSANSANGSGAAYVFTRSAGVWSQQAYLKASNTGAGDLFGISVAIAGDTVVVGAYGEASNATGVNGTQSDNSAGTSGAAYVYTGPELASYQPDNAIAIGAGAPVGCDIYNTTAVDQVKKAKVSIGRSKTFTTTIKNDGTVSDTFTVLGTRKSSKFSAKYLDETDTDITAAVVAGTYNTPSLAPGATYTIRLKVTVKSNALVGNRRNFLITSTSTGNANKQDTVKATVTAK